MNWLLVLLQITFVLLKAFGVVVWSWWVVFIPSMIAGMFILFWFAIWLLTVWAVGDVHKRREKKLPRN